jgi:cytochrome c2
VTVNQAMHRQQSRGRSEGRTRVRWFGVTALVIAAGACATAAADTAAAPASDSVPAPAPPAATVAVDPSSPLARFANDPAAIKRGKSVFVGTCSAYCHANRDEERDAPSLFDCTWRHGGSDAEVFASIANGVTNTRMPAWKGALPQGDDDIWRVIAYLRSASVCTSNAAAPSTAATPAPAAH